MIGFAFALRGCGPDVLTFIKRTRHPLEPVYAGMLRRCYNPNEPLYHRYGGRGIKVCDRWRVRNGIGFSNFVTDIGIRPQGDYSLDRVNNNGNYEPSNCRWATRLEQNRNKSNSRKFAIIRETRQSNAYTRRRKGRTVCKNGHEYTKENTRVMPDKSRACRICARISSAKYKKGIRNGL